MRIGFARAGDWRRAWSRLALLGAVAAAGCGGGTLSEDETYTQEILAARADKDENLRNASDSPIPKDQRDHFLPLSYFALDPAYAVPASLTPATERIVIEMPTSTGQVRKEERVGTLQFTLKGQQLSLGAFVESGSPDVNRLFVPFTDLTSGTETYPAGRYLDLDRTPTGIYIIDFNKAYHPYCYFSALFDCPYPPSDNRLPIPVRAGERLPERQAASR